MSRLTLSFGCWNYDRTRGLADGSVAPDGIDLNYLDMPVEETFFRMLRHREFDVAEMSLSSYTLSLFREPRQFVAIPVFPSRFFRHSCIYVNADAGIRAPTDLIGKRVGNPEYQMTAPVWIRGILSDHYGVPVDSVTYVTGGEEQPGRSEKLKLDLPPAIRVERIGPTQTLAQMLRDGEIDALYTARTPSSFHAGDGRVRRLFENYPDVERAYFRDTGIFPIMHTVVHPARRVRAAPVGRRSRCTRHSSQAQRRDLRGPARDGRAEGDAAVADRARRGDRGADGRRLLAVRPRAQPRHAARRSCAIRTSRASSKRVLEPEELFAPETLESFVI